MLSLLRPAQPFSPTRNIWQWDSLQNLERRPSLREYGFWLVWSSFSETLRSCVNWPQFSFPNLLLNDNGLPVWASVSDTWHENVDNDRAWVNERVYPQEVVCKCSLLFMVFFVCVVVMVFVFVLVFYLLAFLSLTSKGGPKQGRQLELASTKYLLYSRLSSKPLSLTYRWLFSPYVSSQILPSICVFVSRFPKFLYKNTRHKGLGPNQWPYSNLIASVKTSSPNKVTLWGTLG